MKLGQLKEIVDRAVAGHGAETEVSVYEGSNRNLTVKDAAIQVADLSDGHGVFQMGKKQFVLYP